MLTALALLLALDASAQMREVDRALVSAAARGDAVEVARELLKTKVDVDHVNNLGWTALLEAVILGDGGEAHTEIVRLLVSHGAKVNLPDRDGVTALQHARRRGYASIVAILERAGARYRRRIMKTLFAALAALMLALPAHAQAPAGKQRLVIQVSDADPGKWKLALNNAKNVQQDLGASNVEIELVAYGPGIGMLKMESEAGNGVAQAMKEGVKVVACENTMRNQKIKREDMQGGIGYVGAGVVEIMKLQREGWAYLRP